MFALKCAKCHGANGEGASDHPSRLEGSLSIAQLAKLIQETMPEDNPGSLSPDEANEIARYVHETFYSAIARARFEPVRIELSRLTVRQHRHALADLIGSFRPHEAWGGECGLRGEYFAGREPQGAKERAEVRIDPCVEFDFGAAAPVKSISDPRRFSIRWSGSLLAPETGEYDFVIHTEHAARLWVNAPQSPTIDAWVKSGNESQYKATLYLIGGRVYPIRLEFTKAKQGVDDSEEQAKKKDRPPVAEASVALRWRRPRSGVETIAPRFLSPIDAPEEFVCTTPFPPDDRSYGWERGTSISQAWDEATTSAAIEACTYVSEHLNRLAGTSDDAPDRSDRLLAFCQNFTERAFRQPLAEALKDAYIDRQFAGAASPEQAVQRVVLLTLKSPRFLFRELDGDSESYHVASRLSFGLWNSIPDEQLRQAAAKDQLREAAQLRHQAERMLRDVRARAKLREFLLSWLHLDREADLRKDAEAVPNFDAQTITDLRTSLELFLDDVVWSERSDFRELLLDDELYLNKRLVRFYGADAEADEGFERVRIDDGLRAGVLTHPYLMAHFAHGVESSPIHRGVFLARGVLGQSLRPPPEAFAPLAPELHPDLTTRERVTLQTKSRECMTCHRIINPLGFTLESFDGVGRFRVSERGRTIDDRSTYVTDDGEEIPLQGGRALAEFLAGSSECHRAFVEQMFHHLVQQSLQAYGPTLLDELCEHFRESEFNIRELAVEIMVATALVGRETNSDRTAVE